MQAGDQRIRPRPDLIPRGRKYGMCSNFPKCKKGNACTFAHSEAEMHAWNEQLAMIPIESSPTRVTRRPIPQDVKPHWGEFMICSNLPNCKKGAACTFAHSEEERHEWNQQLRKDLNIRKKPTRTPDGGQFMLCANLPNCPNGDLCTFAHSEAEKHLWNKELAGDSTDSTVQVIPGVTATASKPGGKSTSTDVASESDAQEFHELLTDFCREANHKGLDGKGCVILFDEEFMCLLKKYAEKVEKFNCIEKVELLKPETAFRDVKIDIQRAKVIGKIHKRNYNEVSISEFKPLPNKDGDVEKTLSFATKIKKAESVSEIVTFFRELTLNGTLTAQYQGLGTQLGICHKQGKAITDIRAWITEVDEEFKEDVQVPAKTNYKACVIRESILYECDLENVRISTKKPLDLACNVSFSNGNKQKRSYKLQEVLGNYRVCDGTSANDYEYELKGKYRWILTQKRIKTVVDP